MGAAEVICCFFLEEKIHNRPEISDHFHTHVPEVRKTHMQCKTLWEWFGRQEGGMRCAACGTTCKCIQFVLRMQAHCARLCSVRDNMQVHRVLHEHAYRALVGVRRAVADCDAAFATRRHGLQQPLSALNPLIKAAKTVDSTRNARQPRAQAARAQAARAQAA